MFAFDRDCRFIAWNRAMQRISGLGRDEVLGKRVVDVFPFLRDTGNDRCFSAVMEGQEWSAENHPYGPSETGVFESHYFPLRDEQNNIAGGIAVITDITARKQAEEATHRAYRQLAFHVESSPLAVVEWDSDFRVSRWSASAERLFGWKAEDVIGKHVNEWRFVFADDVDAVALVTNRQREGVEIHGVQRNRNYTRDGQILFCEWYNSVLRDDRGKLVSVLSLVLDVTARKSAEEERAVALVRERDARRHAEEADRLKDEFLATLSHELRTPLTSILGFTEILLDQEELTDTQRRFCQKVQDSGFQLQASLNQLVDLSRIEAGQTEVFVQEFSLRETLRESCAAAARMAQKQQVKIDYELA
ncbi:MAG TPA: PAS domain S-box protein, partial [Pyrinomonadaceae bacterium]